MRSAKWNGPLHPFAGSSSFYRFPIDVNNASNASITILGVPFDTATSNRPGTRLGPRHIRLASLQEAGEVNVYGWKALRSSQGSIVDGGDLQIPFHVPGAAHEAIKSGAAKAASAGSRLLCLGGDHYITFPLLQALVESRGGEPVGLVHFDAHTDTWEPYEEDDVHHGTMFHHAITQGLIDPLRSVQVGIRTTNPVADSFGITIIDSMQAVDMGPAGVAQVIKEVIGDNDAYVTFDVDALDPSCAPGTGTPVAGGLTTREALGTLRALEGIRVVGGDVVEVSPPFDHAEITSIAAANIAKYILCLMDT